MEPNAIMELLRRRDEQAISECSKSYGRLLHRVAYNVVGSHEDAEECVQDALQKLWESSPSEPIVNIRAYLIAVTRNFALLRVRSASTEKRGGGEYTLALSELEGCLPSPQNVESEVEARAMAKAIDSWLTKLPADDRVLFIRRYRMGDEISLLAEEMGERPAKVSKRLHTLREKLRKYLVKENYLV